MVNLANGIRYNTAIKRNLFELAHALLELKALTAWDRYTDENEIYVHGESYFSISQKALFNDMVSHAIKVLELDKCGDSSTFWYILKTDTLVLKNLKDYSEEKIYSLQSLAVKLKHVRDKTHFHLDKNGILDHHKIWQEADIKGRELSEGLKYLFGLLCGLYKNIFKESFLYHPDDYDDTDLIKLLNFAASSDLINVVPKMKELR
ncbi:MAG: hypothetical protein MUC39_00065 [Candidatus Omnitrophica bacterium]|nr:hypothetical protein [Candidatus Omnitrophota bacterium]